MEISGALVLNKLKSKDVPLEALRGIAALIVVLDHSITGFLPKYYGYIPGLAKDRLQGSIFYCFFNGSAAVCLFFVLSGYILTRRYCASGDVRILLKGAVKRWPRLAGPVFVTTLASYALFFFHLYDFQKAGVKSGSPWLAAFANGFTQISGTDATIHSIHYWNMLQQGLFFTFFRGDWLFDSSLWTMHPELVGSFIAFGVAPILLESVKSSIWITVWLIVMTLLILHFVRPDLVAFPIGVGMAVLLPRNYALRLRFAVPAFLLALYLLGYPNFASGAYAIFRTLDAGGMPGVYPQIAGAAILISLFEILPQLRAVFSGKVSAFVGELSFPIYLVHALVICSAASSVYLNFGAIPAIVTVFVVSILASLPLMRFNNWWMAEVNRLAERFLHTRERVAVTSKAVFSEKN
jgi:peptidoglycan/LPS O-acetylase OafA/YrhL